MPRNQDGFAHGILIVIAALAVIGYLTLSSYSSLKDNLFSVLKRDDDTHAALQKHPLDAYYNPYGDAWGYKKAPNSSIMAMLTSACYRYGPKGASPTSPTEEVEFLSKSNPLIVLEECAIVSDSTSNGAFGSATNARIRDLALKLKQKTPPVKFIGYYSFADFGGLQAGHNTIREASRGGADDYWERMFVHVKGSTVQNESTRLTFTRNGSCAADQKEAGHFVMNITDPNYQNFIGDAVVSGMIDLNMGGLLSDLVYHEVLPGRLCQNEVPDEIKAAWPAAQIQLHEKLKSKMNTRMGNDSLLFVNANMDNGFYKEMVQSGRADGIMLEDPMNRAFQINEPNLRTEPVVPFVPGAERYEKLKNVLTHMKSIDKYALITINTNINGTNASNTTQSWEETFASYYLAAYLNIFQSPKQMLLYHTPVPLTENVLEGAAFKSAAFFREWDINIGNPTHPSEQVAPGVFLRRFERAYVYLNTTYENYRITGGSGLFDRNGVEINNGVVPAKRGAIFMTREQLDAFNATTSPPPPPPPTGSFTLNPPETFCSGTNSHIKLSWTAMPNGPRPGYNSGYFVYVDGVYTFNHLHNLELTDPNPKNYGQVYKYKVESVMIPGDRVFSNEQSVTAKDCTPAPPPATCASLGGKCLDTLNKDTEGNTCTGGTHRGVLDCPAVRPYCYTGSTCTAPSPSPSASPLAANVPYLTEKSVAYCNGNIPRVHLEWNQTPGVSYYKVYRTSSAPNSGIKLTEQGHYAYNYEPAPAGEFNYGIEAMVGSGSVGGPFKAITAPSCPPRSGDTDFDADVDIFDYNSIVSNFDKSPEEMNPTADVDFDTDVDIFDYNIGVSNFGK